MPKPTRPLTHDVGLTNPGDLLMEAEALLEKLAVGTWVPNLDLCETGGLYTVRVELPGVDLEDVSLAIQDGILRVQLPCLEIHACVAVRPWIRG